MSTRRDYVFVGVNVGLDQTVCFDDALIGEFGLERVFDGMCGEYHFIGTSLQQACEADGESIEPMRLDGKDVKAVVESVKHKIARLSNKMNQHIDSDVGVWVFTDWS